MISEGFLNPEAVVGNFGILPAMRIADFGCGAGHIAILVAQAVGSEGKITALDIMEDKLDSLRSQARSANLNNIETTRANLEVLGSSGLNNDSQDLVLLINIMFQSNKKLEILREALRVVKSGGKVILVEWKKSSGGKGQFGPPDSLRTSDGDMTNLFTQAGFKLDHPFSAGQFHYGLIFKK